MPVAAQRRPNPAGYGQSAGRIPSPGPVDAGQLPPAGSQPSIPAITEPNPVIVRRGKTRRVYNGSAGKGRTAAGSVSPTRSAKGAPMWATRPTPATRRPYLGQAGSAPDPPPPVSVRNCDRNWTKPHARPPDRSAPARVTNSHRQRHPDDGSIPSVCRNPRFRPLWHAPGATAPSS